MHYLFIYYLVLQRHWLFIYYQGTAHKIFFNLLPGATGNVYSSTAGAQSFLMY